MTTHDQPRQASALRTATFPVVYMFGITFVAAAVLIGLARATRERVEANRRILFERAVLEALAIELPAGARGLAVHAAFVEQVRPPTAGQAAYLHYANARLKAFALPFEGQGFWNTIRGVVGIAAGQQELTGLAVYEQTETPGLGAEIVKPAFRNQFRGLRLAGGKVTVEFRPPGSELGANQVHAITGATQTCRRLERILADALTAWSARTNPEEPR